MNHTGNITDSMPALEDFAQPGVLRMVHGCRDQAREMLKELGLCLVRVDDQSDIPGSYWGDEEAGLIGNCLMARDDTPVHSVLHEACHYLCMDRDRRTALHTDAGGDYDEENAVCYLQILLADKLDYMGRERMFSDMDRWGYSFRLGSAKAWFLDDADDARRWLIKRGHLDQDGHLALPPHDGAGRRIFHSMPKPCARNDWCFALCEWRMRRTFTTSTPTLKP